MKCRCRAVSHQKIGCDNNSDTRGDFIKATIEQIVEGAALAQESIKSRGGIVNPTSMRFQKDGAWNQYSHAMPQEVVFDVGLTSTDKSGSSEGIGVFLGSISLGKKMILARNKWQ